MTNDLMGRNAKRGLDYFPMDIDMFTDLKIRKLIKRQGGKAITVYAYLLCSIYKEGYYMQWDDELPFICSEFTGFDEAYISEVIKSCLALGLFHKPTFDTSQVLTSRGIQERYQRICQQSRRVCQVAEYNLLTQQQPQAAPQRGAKRISEAQPLQQAASQRSPKRPSEPQPPSQPSQPPETIDEEIAILKQEEAWLDQLQCLHGIPVDRLRQQLDEFRAECIANGKESHDSIADAKYHFNSWLRITIKNHTPDVTDKQKREAKRRGNILPHDAAKKKDYGSSF